jgi:AraC-like DNA-binding protein/ligand-binding sensor protein
MSNPVAEVIGTRQEIELLFSKADSILTAYEKAADCVVSVIDSDDTALDSYKYKMEGPLCSCCGEYCQNCGQEGGTGEFLCGQVHQKGIMESRRLGSSYVYMCPLGLVFWISPLYLSGRYAGALVAGKVLGIDREEALKRAQSWCGDLTGMAMDHIKNGLEAIPQRNNEEIKAMAQMMLICAQQISAGSGLAAGRGPDTGRRDGAMTELPAGEERKPLLQNDRESKMSAAGRSNSNERLLIASLRRGDSAAAGRILGEILDTLKTICPGNLQFFRCQAIELVVLLSRSCADEEESGPLLEENNLYLKKINDSATIGELETNLHRIVERMAGRIFSFQGLRHASALRRAERFIWKNYTRKVSLEEIAAASGLSAPYFSTIFREEMGEYLSAHLNRLRVEKACTMLLETNVTLNTISESCGFEDQSWFSKIFKSYTGYSPGKYREQGGMSWCTQDRDCAG